MGKSPTFETLLSGTTHSQVTITDKTVYTVKSFGLTVVVVTKIFMGPTALLLLERF